ncbi:MAG TPA: hypothetical protein VK507_12805, partial [Iamia sp.]|nr:hypothetical protein [Iamia sp.]
MSERRERTLGELDLHLLNEGRHRRLHEVLGAHPATVDGVDGVAFSVWAPDARAVSVVGDFTYWDGATYPMEVIGTSGVWQAFVPGIGVGERYK